MNILDIVIILILVMFAIIGFKKGAIKSIVSLVGIILVFIIAFYLKGTIGNLLCKWLPFFNFAGSIEGVITLNIVMYQMIAFLIIYSLLYSIYIIIMKISGAVQKIIHMTIILILPSKMIGAVITLIEGYILIFIILLALLIPLKNTDIFIESNLANKIVYHSPIISKSAESVSKTINEVYELGERLSKKEISKNEANLETMDVMLKYKIVSPKTASQLVALDKLNNIKGLEQVIAKYE